MRSQRSAVATTRPADPHAVRRSVSLPARQDRHEVERLADGAVSLVRTDADVVPPEPWFAIIPDYFTRDILS